MTGGANLPSTHWPRERFPPPDCLLDFKESFPAMSQQDQQQHQQQQQQVQDVGGLPVPSAATNLQMQQLQLQQQQLQQQQMQLHLFWQNQIQEISTIDPGWSCMFYLYKLMS